MPAALWRSVGGAVWRWVQVDITDRQKQNKNEEEEGDDDDDDDATYRVRRHYRPQSTGTVVIPTVKYKEDGG